MLPLREIEDLCRKLVAFSGVNAVRAILPMSINDHWVEFELQISRNEQNDLELPYEIWDAIRDLVIDYEWKLRDDTNEKWYFGVDYFEHFSEISYGSKEVFNSSGSSLNLSSKISQQQIFPMPKILFITVGGSHQPIATSIKSQKPDRVVFICSDGARGSKSQVIGDGKPCEVRKGTEVIESLPNIPTQLELGDRFDAERDLVLIQEPDNLSECYDKINQKIREIKQESPSAEIVADYTGGTKTMSVALATASLDNEILLFITTNTTRQNLIKVESGERSRKATTTGLLVTRTVEKALPVYLQNYNYTAAIADLQNLIQSTELSAAQTRQIDELLDQCEGFDAWDRFDHRVALSRLQPYMKQANIQPYGLFLKKAIASRGLLDTKFDTSNGMMGHGYEVVEDLLLNADRRASQRRYDDAVGRLYRAIELLEQVRLFKQYGILTGDVDVAKLPESLQPEYEARKASHGKKKVQIALFQSYDLLSKFDNDPLGQLFLKYKDRIHNSLEIRNNSLFAHGFQPISESDYRHVNQVIGEFIREGIAAVIPAKLKSGARQFPQVL